MHVTISIGIGPICPLLLKNLIVLLSKCLVQGTVKIFSYFSNYTNAYYSHPQKKTSSVGEFTHKYLGCQYLFQCNASLPPTPSPSVALNRIEGDTMALNCREGGGLQQMEQNTHVLGICGRIRPQTNFHLFTLQGGGERCGAKTSPSAFAHTFQGLACSKASIRQTHVLGLHC